MQPWRYEKQIVVETYFSDFVGEMTVPGIFRCAQSAAMEHTRHLGYGEDVLSQSHCAFMMTKAILLIGCPMKTGEAARVVTTAYAPDKIYYYRITEFFGPDGTPRASMRTQWVLVDTEKNRILRTSNAISGFPFHSEKIEFDFTIEADGHFESAGMAYARYTAIDQYRHMNNAVYADIVMDALSDKLFSGARPKRFLISYVRQAEMGAEIALQRENTKGIVRGFSGGALCFEAAVELHANEKPGRVPKSID